MSCYFASGQIPTDKTDIPKMVVFATKKLKYEIVGKPCANNSWRNALVFDTVFLATPQKRSLVYSVAFAEMGSTQTFTERYVTIRFEPETPSLPAQQHRLNPPICLAPLCRQVRRDGGHIPRPLRLHLRVRHTIPCDQPLPHRLGPAFGQGNIRL